MRLTLEALRVVECIDRLGSFAAAAEELNRVRSALTYTIKKLESDLDVAIFDRSDYRVKLTPAGKTILAKGIHILNLSQDLENKIQQNKTGIETEFTVAYDELIPFQKLLPIIKEFCEHFPEVKLKVSTERLGGCWEALTTDRAQIAIGLTNPGPDSIQCQYKSLGMMEFVFVVTPGHPLALKEKPLSEEDICQYRSIAASQTTSDKSHIRYTGMYSNQPTLTVDSFQNKLEAHIQGVGIGYLPYQWAKTYIDSGQLIAKKANSIKPKTHLSLAWRSEKKGRCLKWWIENVQKHKKRILSEATCA